MCNTTTKISTTGPHGSGRATIKQKTTAQAAWLLFRAHKWLEATEQMVGRKAARLALKHNVTGPYVIADGQYCRSAVAFEPFGYLVSHPGIIRHDKHHHWPA
jgi:hypothetical protein